MKIRNDKNKMQHFSGDPINKYSANLINHPKIQVTVREVHTV